MCEPLGATGGLPASVFPARGSKGTGSCVEPRAEYNPDLSGAYAESSPAESAARCQHARAAFGHGTRRRVSGPYRQLHTAVRKQQVSFIDLPYQA